MQNNCYWPYVCTFPLTKFMLWAGGVDMIEVVLNKHFINT